MNHVDQPRVFRSLRWRLFRNGFDQAVNETPMRLFTMFASTAIIWAFTFGVSFAGFLFLIEKRIPGTGAIVGTLFDLTFFSLFGMLTFSTGLIVYASLYTAPEAKFLLTTPARADHIFASKFQSACIFSSWAFLALGSPVLIGYGIAYGVSWYFYAMLLPFFAAFIMLPGSLGAILAILLVRFIPRRRKQFFILLILATVLAGIVWVARTIMAARDTFADRDALQGLIGQFSLAQSPFVPSHWMSRGLLEVARGEVVESLFSLALLWTHGLFVFVIAAWLAKRFYRQGFDRISSHGESGRRYQSAWPDRVMELLVWYLDRQTRLLVVKDFRSFRRDPAQWVQIVILGGLMILYGFNTRRFYTEDVSGGFQGVIALLNLTATSFLMCAYLVRFIYPLLSLEGRKFWILGLLPLKRDKLLWGKFFFAATGTVLIGCGLILLSDLLLAVSPTAVVLHVVAIAFVGVGMSGLSVGIGASVPNFRETDPSKIVVGFGGTLNTIVSLFYLAIVILSVAGPFHLWAVGGTSRPMPWWVFAGVPVGVILAALAVVVPMRIGIRTLRRIEF